MDWDMGGISYIFFLGWDCKVFVLLICIEMSWENLGWFGSD